jgi:hypothetical protein
MIENGPPSHRKTRARNLLVFCAIGFAAAGCSLSSAPPWATPVYNGPGRYVLPDRCLETPLLIIDVPDPILPTFHTLEGYLTVCVTDVVVGADLKMTFHVEYSLTPDPENDMAIELEPDTDNDKIFLTDNNGHRYDHEQVTGCATEGMKVDQSEQSCKSSFLFPPAREDARSFVFYYSTANDIIELEQASIPDIILIDPS